MADDYDEGWVDKANARMTRPRPYNVCPRCFGSVGILYETSLPSMRGLSSSDLLPPAIIKCTCPCGHKWQQTHQ